MLNVRRGRSESTPIMSRRSTLRSAALGQTPWGMTWSEFCALIGVDRLDNKGAKRLRSGPRTKKIGRCYILDREIMLDDKSNLIYPFTAFSRIDCAERPSLTLRWGGAISDQMLLRVTQDECCT